MTLWIKDKALVLSYLKFEIQFYQIGHIA